MEIDPTDTLLISGIRKQGKTHFVRAFLMPYFKEKGIAVNYHRDPGCIKRLPSGVHHIIDDFDKVPMKKLGNLLEVIQDIAMAGRHDGTGLTIIVHHPTWTAKEFRLTPDHIIAFKQPSAAAVQWYRPLLGKLGMERVVDLPKTVFIWKNEEGLFLCRLQQQGGRWEVEGVRQ